LRIHKSWLSIFNFIEKIPLTLILSPRRGEANSPSGLVLLSWANSREKLFLQGGRGDFAGRIGSRVVAQQVAKSLFPYKGGSLPLPFSKGED
jgi:hypothetical protein